MASNRSRANNTLGTRLNSMSARIEDQEAKNRGNSDSTIKERLDALEAKQEQLESPNWRVEQESQFLISAFPILSGGSSGQPIGPASESGPGLVELATAAEATLVDTSGPVNLAMTPQRVLDAINTFAPIADRGQTSKYISDLNTATKVGFVRSDNNGTNVPPGGANAQYLVLVHSGDTVGVGGSGSGYIVQDAWEVSYQDVGGGVTNSIIRQRWTRSRDSTSPFPWTAWIPATGSTTKEGTLRLATTSEASAGISQTIAVTPAGLKAVADTKAALSHVHSGADITSGTIDPARLPAATDTTIGAVELATPAEATTGTDTVRAVTPQGLKTVADTKAPLVHTHTSSQITDFNTATDARVNALVPAASTTVVGKLSLATDAETQAGTVSTKAVTPSSLNARTATETRTGIARLATLLEAQLDPGAVDAIMTPQRVLDSINTFAPVAARGQKSAYSSDFNLNTSAGFVWGGPGPGTLNCPPGGSGSTYNVITQSSDSVGLGGSGAGYVVQTATELYYVSNGSGGYNSVILQTWVRSRDSSGPWTAWIPATGTTAKEGTVRLATTSEATTGTSQTIAVTPAGLKTVADTKAALVHTHVMSDITDLPARSSAATANALIQRDANGRAQVATPSVAADIATKGYVDSLTTVNAGRGTTAERDAYFGAPTITADQVALANRKVTWFNTDLGWQESYYVVQGTSGLTARGLITGAPAGWYPISDGPRIRLFSNGGQAHSNGTEFSNWKAFAPAGTVTENDSYKFGNILTRPGTNSWIETSLWGKYDIIGAMYFPGGTGTGVFELTNYRSGSSTYVLQIQKPIPLLASYGQIIEWGAPDQYIRPGDRIHFRTIAASWTVGGGFTHLTIRYVGPPLDTAS